jgi:hypothetical protein
MRGSRAALILALAAAVVGHGLIARAQGTEADRAKAIESTAKVLLEPGPSGPVDGPGAVARLVEIAVEIGEGAPIPAPARAKLAAAREQVRSHSALDPRCAAAIREAYLSLGDGQPYKFPADVKSIEAARASGRVQIDRAVVALRAGRREDSAREILGTVLMVITPMEAPQ